MAPVVRPWLVRSRARLGNAVVGFLGAIAARRQMNGEAALVCNISSWAVHAKYRGWGMSLLAGVLRDGSVTYTAFTPAPFSWAALLAQRFTPLHSHRIFMPPLLQAEALFGPKRPVISFNPAVVRERLTCQQRQIFDDHAPYDCLQLTVSDGSDNAYLLVKRILVPMRTCYRSPLLAAGDFDRLYSEIVLLPI